MAIWKQTFDIEQLSAFSGNTLVSHLGIQFIEKGDDFLRASMPVNAHTVQPMRLLHGGASAALAETVGSVASLLCLDDINVQYAVGIELNISHLRSAHEGETVYAVCRPYRIGRSVHVWNIEIGNEDGSKLFAACRLTMSVQKKANSN